MVWSTAGPSRHIASPLRPQAVCLRRPARRTLLTWLTAKKSLHARETYDESRGTWDDEYMRTLRSQDPHGRIKVLHPRLTADVLHAFEKEFRGSGLPGKQELWNLPFWSVTLLANLELSGSQLSTGKKSALKRLPVCLGYSVPAVPADHWASGLVLTDTLGDLYDHMRRYEESPPVEDWTGGLHVPESRIVPFSTGYPVVDAQDLSTAVARRYAHHEDWAVYCTVSKVTSFAFPNRRHVCRAVYKDSEAFLDMFLRPLGEVPISFNRFVLPKTGPKIALKPDVRMDEVVSHEHSDAGFRYILKADSETTTVKADKQIIHEKASRTVRSDPLTVSNEAHILFAEYVNKALRNSNLNWDDPNILRLEPVETSGQVESARNGLKDLSDYATDFVHGRRLPIKPAGFSRTTSSSPGVSASGPNSVPSPTTKLPPKIQSRRR